MTQIKAIETRYKGYRFRSRLEARWAVFFDSLGVRWEYEPEGYDMPAFGWYLPDFILERKDGEKTIMEIKGDLPPVQEMDKLETLCLGLGFYGVMSFGSFQQAGWLSVDKSVGFDGRELKGPLIGENGIDPFNGYSNDKTALAIIAARSARFEHGEVCQ